MEKYENMEKCKMSMLNSFTIVIISTLQIFKKKLLSNFQDNTITPRFKIPVTGTLLWNSLPLVPEKGIQDHFLFKLKTKVFKYQPGARILLGSSYL